MKKVFCICICFLLLFVSVCMNAFALSSSTFSDVTPDNPDVLNLLSYSVNFDNFLYSDYVLYQYSDVGYYLVWSDELVYDGNVVTSDADVQFVSLTNGVYSYGVSNTLSLNVNHMTVSNIGGLGFKSPLYSQLFFYDHFKNFSIFGLSALLVIAFCSLRKVFNK